MRIFANRKEAGRELAEGLRSHVRGKDPCILALPRGGLPVAAEVARALDAPLDVLVVRKIGAPGQPELALGAIATGGVVVMNESLSSCFEGADQEIAATMERERRELARREQAYRGGRPPLDVTNRTTVIVDDGIATGATVRAAVRALRARGARDIIVAVPTAPADVCERLEQEADGVVCLDTPAPFIAVGRWYEDFSETTDDEVRELLDAASHRSS